MRPSDKSMWLTPTRIAKACKASNARVIRRGPGALRVHTDSRTVLPGDCFVALSGDAFDAHDFLHQVFAAGVRGVVVSRDLEPLEIPDDVFVVRVDDTSQALMQIAAEHRCRHKAKIVGVTGSCGKTSVKDMLGSVLTAAMPTVYSPMSFNNQVGVPLSLFQIQAETKAAVIELGTNAPGEIAALTAIAQPDIGIITCISEAHLSGLGSLGGVAAEKGSMLAGLRPGGLAILNGDDCACKKIAEQADCRVLQVRVGAEADWFATDVRFHGLGTSFKLQGEHCVTLPRTGSHNVYNALLCIAAATELGVSLDTLLRGLCDAAPSSRRMECHEVGQVMLFDDTYNMNPASARAAVSALSGLKARGRKLIVFGEMLELGDRSQDLHEELGRAVASSELDLLMVVGDGALPIARGALASGMRDGQIVRVGDPSHALDDLLGRLEPEDFVLCKASRRVGLDRLVDGLRRELKPKRLAEGGSAKRARGRAASSTYVSPTGLGGGQK